MKKFLVALLVSPLLSQFAHATVYQFEFSTQIQIAIFPNTSELHQQVTFGGTTYNSGDTLTARFVVDTEKTTHTFKSYEYTDIEIGAPSFGHSEYHYSGIAMTLSRNLNEVIEVFSSGNMHITVGGFDPYSFSSLEITAASGETGLWISLQGMSPWWGPNADPLAAMVPGGPGDHMAYRKLSPSGAQEVALVGLWTSEVSAVPEPYYYGMFLLGLGVIWGQCGLRLKILRK